MPAGQLVRHDVRRSMLRCGGLGMQIRRALPSDAEQIVALIDKVFGLERSHEWLNHFHHCNPAGDSIMFVAADDSGRVVSYRSIASFTASYRGNRIRCGQLSDACTHPDYRGMGLYGKVNGSAIDEFFLSGGDLIYAFPGRENYAILTAKFGFRHLMSMRHALFPIRHDCWSGTFMRILSRIHSRAFPNPRFSLASIRSVTDDGAFSRIAPSDCIGHRLGFDRSAVTMKWRLHIPGRRYWIAELDEFAHAIIGESCRRGLKVCTILNLKAKSPGSARRLLMDICAWAGSRDYDAVFTWMSPSDSWTLVRAGFVPAPSKTDLLVRFRADFGLREILLSADRWHVELLDTDAY